MRQLIGHCGLLAFGLCRLAAAEPEVDASQLPRVPPTPPEQALSTFKVKPGFGLELVAAEPLVVSPVAMSFDEEGRLYVIEMRDYSERRPERLGRVRRLEDLDGDGRFEHSTVFADGLPWPTAVTCWAGGVFVGATPDILWMKDTNGDGVADEREVIFTGFASDYAPFETNKLNVQALMNSFQWSVDNRIHGATSFSGGKVKRVDTPFVRDWLQRTSTNTQHATRNTPPLDLRGRDFSFDPRTLEMRAESGGGQHGMTFDNQGRKFVCSNSDHIQQIVYEDRYAARNPYYNMPSPRVSIAVDGPAAEVFRISPDEPWRVLRTQWRVAGLVSGPVEGGGRASGYFTGATGLTIYRGDAYGEDFVNDAFIGDAGGNLVHRKKLRSDGIVLRAERPADEQKVEFLASTDNWFRPVQFANGPDGCLYIVDMYREVIEHPWSLPPNIKKHLDLNSGNDRGRIYRIVPEELQRRPRPHLSEASTPELVKLLEHPSGWHRDTASRLLFERQDESAVDSIRKLLGPGVSPLAAIHALHALAGLHSFELRDWEATRAIRYHAAAVQVQALRVAEESYLFLKPEFMRRVAIVATQPHPELTKVKFQLALSLSTGRYEAPLDLMLNVLSAPVDNWVYAAALNAIGMDAADLFIRATRQAGERVWNCPPDIRRKVLEDLVRLGAATAPPRNLRETVARLGQFGTQYNLYARFLEGMRQADRPLSDADPVHELKPWFDSAARAATDPKRPEAERLDAVHLLALSQTGAPPAVLYDLLDARYPTDVQAAVISELGRFPGSAPAERLMTHWSKSGPVQKLAALEFFLKRSERIHVLLGAVEGGQVRTNDLSASQIQWLRTHSDAKVRTRAVKALGKPAASSREQVVSSFLPALKLNGVASEGRKIFISRCATCHKRGEEGTLYGLDLRTVKDAGKEKILTNILDPNREVAPNFAAYFVDMKSGENLTGIIVRESAAVVTLREANGRELDLGRANIASLYTSGRSLMPEGLEVGLLPQDMADLLEFIVSGP